MKTAFISACVMVIATLFALEAHAAELEVVTIAPRAGHVHPSIGRTKNGTLVVVCKGADNRSLVCVRSSDGGKSWTKPTPIETTAKRPASIREVKIFEIYPGTVDVLPDDRVLVTWNYIADDKQKDGYYERALLYTLSADQGQTWSEQELIGPLEDGKHLGAVRHNVLPWDNDRWLLSLRVGPPRVFDPRSKSLIVFPLASPDRKEHAFQQIVRTPKGTLLAMGPHFLRSTDNGLMWKAVENFPAAPIGDSAEGRYLTVLADGRVLVTWGVGTQNKGLRYNVSNDDGQTWNTDHTITLLPESSIAARYYSARTIQVDDQNIGTVFVGNGVQFVKVKIDEVVGANAK